ncbi:hypothetical protein CR513_15644, partial [Mucuna pruriens]
MFPIGKATLSPFPISTIKSNECFDLIHTFGGLYSTFYVHDHKYYFLSLLITNCSPELVMSPYHSKIALLRGKHGLLLNVARALMNQSNPSKMYWSYIVLHVAHVINMLPTPILNVSSPHEKLYKVCLVTLCFGSTSKVSRTKFYIRASKCVFLGYKVVTKGFILLNISNREIFVFRNVVFSKNVFP